MRTLKCKWGAQLPQSRVDAHAKMHCAIVDKFEQFVQAASDDFACEAGSDDKYIKVNEAQPIDVKDAAANYPHRKLITFIDPEMKYFDAL